MPSARADQAYTPAPAASVPGYFAQPMPCKISKRYDWITVECKDKLLETKSLRELAIARNTIYARYGWDGYRKAWLRDYFHAQPWFKPNPKFNYKQLSDVDRANAHFIGSQEQSLHSTALTEMRDDIYARYGRIWDDIPEWTLKNGKTVRACDRPGDVDDTGDNDEDHPSTQCEYEKTKWYKPNKKYSPDQISADDRIELGLLARAMGNFALDERGRGKSEQSLDQLLTLTDLRQLSLRDLRLLRNTIYARRGRPFKSEIIRDHFKGMNWYKVRADYSDKLLSANDVRNIGLIKTVENEQGGPLTDEDWLTEPLFDGA
jgi:YARHG domain